MLPSLTTEYVIAYSLIAFWWQLQIFAFASAVDTCFNATINVKLENMDSSQLWRSIGTAETWITVTVVGKTDDEHERKEISDLSEVYPRPRRRIQVFFPVQYLFWWTVA